MPFYSISRNDQQEIISQLEQALYNHRQWHSALIRTLICQLPPDKHDILPEAHKECRFGQWYYHLAFEKLGTHPGFVAIGDVHQRMHHLAANLLSAARISTNDYDIFANILERLQLEILTLKREIEDSLYNHDSLTAAIGRINMLPVLREQQVLVKRGNQTCCIVMMDLDNFKVINDQYGHQAGDQVLVETVAYIIAHIRPYDKIFRYGGEEFLLCMQQTELEQGHEIIEKLREGIAKNVVVTEKNIPLQITASFGLATLDSDEAVEQSIERADQAVYLAKAEGRNCSRVWKAELMDGSNQGVKS